MPGKKEKAQKRNYRIYGKKIKSSRKSSQRNSCRCQDQSNRKRYMVCSWKNGKKNGRRGAEPAKIPKKNCGRMKKVRYLEKQNDALKKKSEQTTKVWEEKKKAFQHLKENVAVQNERYKSADALLGKGMTEAEGEVSIPKEKEHMKSWLERNRMEKEELLKSETAVEKYKKDRQEYDIRKVQVETQLNGRSVSEEELREKRLQEESLSQGLEEGKERLVLLGQEIVQKERAIARWKALKEQEEENEHQMALIGEILSLLSGKNSSTLWQGIIWNIYR